MDERYLTGAGPPIDRSVHKDICHCGEIAVVRLNDEWLCLQHFDERLRTCHTQFKALMEEGNDGEN